MPLRTLAATRYVTPLREGGSVPVVVDASDGATYVLKFRGAAQGPKALIAELIGGEVARTLGLPVPELVLLEVDAMLGRSEPNPELQAPLKASVGLNLGLGFLPGALAFDPALHHPAPDLAARIVWLDAFIANVDRTARNTNLLMWHNQLQLIDHGAALYYQHDWPTFAANAGGRFPAIRDHVLLPFAADLTAADAALAPLLTPERLRTIVADIPDDWLASDGEPPDAARAVYVDFLTRRLQSPRAFAEEAARARAQRV